MKHKQTTHDTLMKLLDWCIKLEERIIANETAAADFKELILTEIEELKNN